MMRFTPRAASPARHFRSAPGREHARRDVEYALVEATLAQITDAAVLLSSEHIAPAVWVPMFRLDAVSRVAVARAARGDTLKLQIELKTVLEKRLV